MSCDWRGDVGEGYGPWGSQPSAAPQLDEAASLGYLGELGVGPLVWLRRRLFDSSIHAFLERDPLFGPSGVPGEFTYPYQYAANNPLSWVDPSGLKPISMSDYQNMAQAEANGHWAQCLVVVAGVALVAATGGAALSVMLPAILPAIAIGGVAGVGTAISEKVSGQPFDPCPPSSWVVQWVRLSAPSSAQGASSPSPLVPATPAPRLWRRHSGGRDLAQ